MFVFNFAGYDVTANSLAIGICLLATRPDIQDWIAEEINAVLAGVESKESSYEAAFPRLPRCLAVVVSDPPAYRGGFKVWFLCINSIKWFLATRCKKCGRGTTVKLVLAASGGSIR